MYSVLDTNGACVVGRDGGIIGRRRDTGKLTPPDHGWEAGQYASGIAAG
jgi:hypothetical protein